MYYYLCLFCILFGFGTLCDGKESYIYKTLHLTTPVDHFSFSRNDTFQLRYLVNDTFWKPGAPIFFYTGNEGDIELFAQNTGFMWDIAPKFNALLVFGEHRYYGQSMPYGNKSYDDPQYLGYLTSTQALADYVYLLNYIQTSNKNSRPTKRSPVIAFGGSYGGMLAAWIRLKYPYDVDGVVASSAPVFQFQGLTNCNTFNNIVADVFKVSSRNGNCAKNIGKSWRTIRNITSSPEGRTWLTNEWKLCYPINGTAEATLLIESLEEIYGNVAMINYPYPTNFLAEVPAHPVRRLCEKLDDSILEGKTLLSELGKAISIYTNYTGSTKCLKFNETAGSLGERGWEFQACTEIVMPTCTDENNEMFEATRWNLTEYARECYKNFGTRLTRDDLAVLEYGGKDADYSNVIFTNGLLDPWSPGGYLDSKTKSVYTILMPEAAHHLDLRASNPDDPVSVVNARMQIESIIHAWLKIFREVN